MTDWSKDIESFEAELNQLASRLASHGITIERKKYTPEAFHSWQFVAGSKEKKFDFSYDGQVSALRYYDTRIVPKDWRGLQHASFRTWEGEDPLAFVEDVLMKEFSS
jgi:hypothetical protein